MCVEIGEDLSGKIVDPPRGRPAEFRIILSKCRGRGKMNILNYILENKQRRAFALFLFMNVCIVVASLSANHLAGMDLWRSIVSTVVVVSIFCFFMLIFARVILFDDDE